MKLIIREIIYLPLGERRGRTQSKEKTDDLLLFKLKYEIQREFNNTYKRQYVYIHTQIERKKLANWIVQRAMVWNR